MIPYIRFSPKLLSYLIVDNYFSELLGVVTVPTSTGPKSSYEFSIKCSLSSAEIDQYEKIVLTVTEKRDEQERQDAVFDDPPSISLPRLAPSLQRKAYSGLYLSNLINKTPEFLLKKTINVSSAFYNPSSVYLHKRLERQQVTNPTVFSIITPQESLNTKDLLRYVNKEKIDVTECVKEPVISGVKSPVNSLNSQQSAILGDPSSFYSRLIKYYLNESPRRSDNLESVVYSVKEHQGKKDYVDFSTKILLDSRYRGNVLTVKFDLYKFNSSVPEETVEKDFDVSKHIEAFESIQKTPEASASLSFDNTTVNVSISDTERQGKISKFNIYKKDILSDGTASPYSLLVSLENQGSILSLREKVSSDLMIFRIVPVDYAGKESNVYTNVVAGKGHQEIGNLTLIASFDPAPRSFKTSLSVYNVPARARHLQVWRRTISRSNGQNEFINFNLIASEERRSDTFDFIDSFSSNVISTGTVLEYYVKCLFDNDASIVSNYVLVDTKSSLLANDSISVRSSEFKKYVNSSGDTEVSFKLETLVDQSENRRVIDSLRENLKEIYDQLVNPSNSADSVVRAAGSKPLYADLYVHEVVRTNLNTSEREVFSLVTDGIFKDDVQNRSIKNIKPISPENSYVYQTFSYVKDPLTLFRNYVKKVKDSANKDYYYMPYKWDNPLINASRTMPPTDEEELPIIDTYDSFTSRPLGEKSARNLSEGSSDFISVTRVKFERIDRNTVKVFWDFNVPDFTKFYDSFIVLKTVNGVRKFIGRTMKNFIYHELKEEDLGNIYYTVIPFTIEFDIDDSSHSDMFVLEPKGIVEPKLL